VVRLRMLAERDRRHDHGRGRLLVRW
jgi:hypothetical protein